VPFRPYNGNRDRHAHGAGFFDHGIDEFTALGSP
jgi:hypothetical protein